LTFFFSIDDGFKDEFQASSTTGFLRIESRVSIENMVFLITIHGENQHPSGFSHEQPVHLTIGQNACVVIPTSI